MTEITENNPEPLTPTPTQKVRKPQKQKENKLNFKQVLAKLTPEEKERADTDFKEYKKRCLASQVPRLRYPEYLIEWWECLEAQRLRPSPKQTTTSEENLYERRDYTRFLQNLTAEDNHDNDKKK